MLVAVILNSAVLELLSPQSQRLSLEFQTLPALPYAPWNIPFPISATGGPNSFPLLDFSLKVRARGSSLIFDIVKT